MDFGAARDFPKLYEKTFLMDGGHSRFRDCRHGAPVGDLPGDRFVVSIQNHDQVGNRAAGDRLSALLSEASLSATDDGLRRTRSSTSRRVGSASESRTIP
jgi:maltooligosyltrehalose trehalohydrolase